MYSEASNHRAHIRSSWGPANLSAPSLLMLVVPIVVLLVFTIITAPPAYGQQSVPATARQAATMPQYAAKLRRQSQSASPQSGARASSSGRYHASARSRWPLDDSTLYENGPINGTTDAWSINQGFVVADTFTATAASGSTISGLSFAAWTFPFDVLQSVEVTITSDPFGGTTYFDGVVNLTQSNCSGNQYGYNVCIETGTFTVNNLNPGTYWVNLQNAVVNDGDPVFWDENSGVGCQSQGCPSQADQTSTGTIPSEAFTVLGGNSCQYPPCQECVYDKPQDGFKIIHNFNSNEDPDAGLAIDQAGNLYGATSDAGSNGRGLAYKLAQLAQGWIFTPLYNFLGDGAGQNPGSEILGPEKALYGSANGGLQNCGSSGTDYCGVVYRLRPSPFACLTSLCTWTEEVIYRFAGAPDGSGPNGGLVFDQAGNLYGTTSGGGAYGLGTVYELTPSNGGWREKVIHSFSGQNGDGAQPVSLLLGQDGNLYGTTNRNGSQGGVYFQLVPSGDHWVEQIIASYGPCNDVIVCTTPLLILENAGSFYVIASYSEQTCNPPNYCHPDTYGIILTLKQVGGEWQFDTFYDTHGDLGFDFAGYDIFQDLSIDSAGSVYATEGGGAILQLRYWGDVAKLPQPNRLQSLVDFQGDDFHNLEMGANGNLYGITGRCNGAPGTVWQLAPQ